MKPEINLETLERGLEQLEPSRPGRKKIMMERLEGRKAAILKARAKGVSFRALSRFFRENGVKVSDFTLRQYVREWTGAVGTRRVRRVRRKRKMVSLAGEKSAPSLPSARPSWKKHVPPEEPREERDASGRRRPPRLAHLRNE